MSVIRLNFIVEGQTEQRFVRQVLMPYLAERSSVCGGDARCVETRKKKGSGTKKSGGVTSYAKPRGDIIRWMKEDRGGDARFTTMFDLYGLPDKFPGYTPPDAIPARERAVAVQEAMLNDIGDRRLLPYIQVHEFEALVLADPGKLASQHPEDKAGVEGLVTMAAGFASPELINGGAETAPSKRIIQAIPTYKFRKQSSGSIVTEKIGIPTLRAKCPHFNAWVEQLEALG